MPAVFAGERPTAVAKRKAPAPAAVQSTAEQAGISDGRSAQPPWPTAWQRYQASDKSRYMPPAKAAKVKLILDRFYANFSKIQTLKLHYVEKLRLSVPSSLTGARDIASAFNYVKTRKDANNRIEDVDCTREPVYFHIDYTEADGSKRGWTLAPDEKDTVRWSHARSWIQGYMDGDFVLVYILAEHGADIKTDVTMDYDLPGLESYVKRARAAHARYDIVDEDAPQMGVKKEYFFNRETGMLDFCVTHMADPPGSAMKLDCGQAWEYWNVGDIYYPKSERWGDLHFTVHGDATWTGLVINGIPADGKAAPPTAPPVKPPSPASRKSK